MTSTMLILRQNSDMAIDHLFEDKPPYGVTEQVSPLVRRVMAENPSVFTTTELELLLSAPLKVEQLQSLILDLMKTIILKLF